MAKPARLRRGGIRIRMVGLVLIPLVPMLVLLVVSANHQRHQSRRDAIDDTLRLSRLSAEQQRAPIQNAHTLLVGAATLWSANAGADRTCQSFVDGIQSQSDQLTNVFAVGDDGRVLCSVMPLPGDPDLIDRPYVQSAIAAGTFHAALEQAGDLVAEPSIAAVLPVPDDPAVALLGATMRLGDHLDSFLTDVGLPDGSEAVIIDRAGRIVATAGDPSEVGRVLAEEELTSRVGTEQVVEGSAQAKGLDGVERVSSFVDIPGADLSAFAVVGIPTKVAYAAGDRTRRADLIVGGAVFLVAITLALLMAELAVARPVRSIVGTIRRIGGGDLSSRSELTRGASELVEVGRSIDVMANDIDARERALLIAQDERERLLGELLEAQEEERRKIAADIHDDTIQTMIAAGMEAQLVRMELGQTEGTVGRLSQVERSIGTAITRLRQLMFELEPPDAGSETLAESIEQYLEAALGESPVEVHVHASREVDLAGPARQVFYRNVRESTLNASRHGQAHHVTVDVGLSEGGVLVNVGDDGVGMRAEDVAKPGHHGLRVMRERTEALGGWFELDSARDTGTTVSFWLPPSSSNR